MSVVAAGDDEQLDADREDRALLARVTSGDRVALELIYRRHAGWVTARLQARCADPELADIAVQDTFLSVWRSAARHRGDGTVAAWIWGIAVRRLVDVLRTRRATPLDPETVTRALAAHQVGPAFEDEVLGDGSNGSLAEAMQALPDDLRAVLVATAIDGLTTKQAAALLGIPQGTVKTRLMRARRHLQEALT